MGIPKSYGVCTHNTLTLDLFYGCDSWNSCNAERDNNGFSKGYDFTLSYILIMFFKWLNIFTGQHSF